MEKRVRDPIVAGEPDEVGKEDEECQGDACPEPAGLEETARRGQDESQENARNVEDDGVFGEQTKADDCSDGEPPARILRFQQPDCQICDEHPPDEIERSVLKLVAFKDLDRRKADSESRRDLREARAAEMFGHEAGEDDDRGLREDR